MIKCIANRTDKNGKQCTIAWHVDDCIATHLEQKELDILGEQMIKHFGEMEIHRGNTHDILGMKLNILREEKNIEIDMTDQLKKMIQEFEEETGIVLSNDVSSPATGNLFTVREGAKQLGEKFSKIFRSTTAKLLYVMKRGRPDIETSVSFLMRRVSKSDEDD